MHNTEWYSMSSKLFCIECFPLQFAQEKMVFHCKYINVFVLLFLTFTCYLLLHGTTFRYYVVFSMYFTEPHKANEQHQDIVYLICVISKDSD